MNFSGFLDNIASFNHYHTVIAIILGLGLLFFTHRKPKLFLGLFFLTLFLAGLCYMIMNLAGPASEQKKRLTHEEKKQIAESP
ncbi:MAG: hypothetical protein ACE144_04515 [Thermodesulfobacteriota bacterium]